MTTAWVPLATVTVAGSTDASITFASIPSIYRDLIVVLDGTVTDFTNVLVSLNGDGASNYTRVSMTGTGSGSGSSNSGTHGGLYMAYAEPSQRVYAQMSVMDYSASDKNKTALSRSHSSGYGVLAHALRWSNNNAVTTMTIATLPSGAFNVGTTISIYGVN